MRESISQPALHLEHDCAGLLKFVIILGQRSPVELSESCNARRILEAVREAYSAASRNPRAKHAFPVGREFAESLGYPGDLLVRLPVASVEAFSGVSNVSVFAQIPSGARILDLGCGAGLDSLVAAMRAGPRGAVVGMDFSPPMLERAKRAAREAGIDNVIFCRAGAEVLPIKSGSIDVALVNGIFNLNPARTAIFAELARVLRSGGVAYAAELVLREPLPPNIRGSETDWFA
jgi:arsenite methyltransferase